MTVALVVIAPLMALFVAFHLKPGWYRPVATDERGLAEAEASVARVFDDFGDHVVRRRPFEIVLHDHELNGWLAALPRLWPDASEHWPKDVVLPALAFRGGRWLIGAEVRRHWRTIVNAQLRSKLVDNGRQILIEVESVSAGSIPLPRRYWSPPVQRAIDELVSENNSRGPSDSGISISKPGSSGESNQPALLIINRFIWANGRRPFRIGSMEPRNDGTMLVRIEPL